MLKITLTCEELFFYAALNKLHKCVGAYVMENQVHRSRWLFLPQSNLYNENIAKINSSRALRENCLGWPHAAAAAMQSFDRRAAKTRS
jgi:hypothetical protein